MNSGSDRVMMRRSDSYGYSYSSNNHNNNNNNYCEDDDSDDSDYLNFTYRPLSRLPTPPPTLSSRSSSTTLHLQDEDEEEPLSPKYRGPAIHLVNLIPSSASLANASVPFVQAMLARANLPIETVALAVCVLDSLDAKFSRKWRLTCPLDRDELTSPTSSSSTSSFTSSFITSSPSPSPLFKRHTLPPAPHRFAKQLHIDLVRPEIIVLAALVIASKFTQDSQEEANFYRLVWGKSHWSNAQLNVTERCIMQSLDYRIMPLCDEDLLADAMVDMQLAGRLDETAAAAAAAAATAAAATARSKTVATWHGEPTPPESVEGSECDFGPLPEQVQLRA